MSDIVKAVKQITPFEFGWTFNYLYFGEDGKPEIQSLPIVGQALVDWKYPDDDVPESHVEAICLEEGKFRTESLLEAADCSKVEMIGIRPPGHTITEKEIEDAKASHSRMKEWRQKFAVA